ncbi:proton-coupled zinc antiporter SLC30A9, mitochondrial-like, partial [Saccoglossus kowalevskii]|uniref:Zinc transporter 9-like n=1 Tax=Saccoglossus kowalevskii TaxID=10224 RepID=A0ABM0LY30_SACKO
MLTCVSTYSRLLQDQLVLFLPRISKEHPRITHRLFACAVCRAHLRGDPKWTYFNNVWYYHPWTNGFRILSTSCRKYEQKNTQPPDIPASTEKVQFLKSGISEAIIKVKPYIRKRVDYSKKYTDNNLITAIRAMNEYLLKSSDLEDLRKTARRSPYLEEDKPSMMMYLRSDVHARAMEVWGSQEALERERKKRQQQEDIYKEHKFLLKKAIKDYNQFYGNTQVENPYLHGYDKELLLKPKEHMLHGSGRVVLTAII